MLQGSQIRKRRGEHGYVLLTLLLIVALMAILAFTLVTQIKFEIKRDREEEMIHRGVQYARAIKAYYKKFNRYPVKIEDLENTNQLRFLRKRYKDPLTGKDFRLLHYGEAKMSMNALGGGMIPGANTIGPNGQLNSAGGLQSSSFGGNSGFGNSNSFGQNSNSTFGQNQQTANDQSTSGGTTQGGDSGQENSPGGNGPNATGPGNSGGTFGSAAGNQQLGGGAIVGVASTSKEKTIREFDKKKKYNEWQFVYDPTLDRGGLIRTPYQPQLAMQGFGGQQNLNGQNGAGQSGNTSGFGNGFGNSSGFGNSFGNSPGGMQNNPSSPGGMGNPSQPNQPPPQQ